MLQKRFNSLLTPTPPSSLKSPYPVKWIFPICVRKNSKLFFCSFFIKGRMVQVGFRLLLKIPWSNGVHISLVESITYYLAWNFLYYCAKSSVLGDTQHFNREEEGQHNTLPTTQTAQQIKQILMKFCQKTNIPFPQETVRWNQKLHFKNCKITFSSLSLAHKTTTHNLGSQEQPIFVWSILQHFPSDS